TAVAKHTRRRGLSSARLRMMEASRLLRDRTDSYKVSDIRREISTLRIVQRMGRIVLETGRGMHFYRWLRHRSAVSNNISTLVVAMVGNIVLVAFVIVAVVFVVTNPEHTRADIGYTIFFAASLLSAIIGALMSHLSLRWVFRKVGNELDEGATRLIAKLTIMVDAKD